MNSCGTTNICSRAVPICSTCDTRSDAGAGRLAPGERDEVVLARDLELVHVAHGGGQVRREQRGAKCLMGEHAGEQ